MKYDISEIEARVSDKQKRFKVIIFSVAAAIIACAITIALSYGKNDMLVLLSAIAIIILLLSLRSIFIKYNPTVLFSREVRGVNILEDEYALLANKRGFKMGAKTSVYATHATGPLLVGKERIQARVYLRLDNGDVYVIDRIRTVHTDLYDEGDVLLKYAGTKYPVIESRNPKKQPCPICGRINSETQSECSGCGLRIYK